MEVVSVYHVMNVSSYVTDCGGSVNIADHQSIVSWIQIQLSFELSLIHAVYYVVVSES